MTHILFHFLIPAIVAALFFRRDWKRAWLIMMVTMIVDIDHLLAHPVYDPTRCGVGFHPLHTFWPMTIYAVLCFVPKMRYVGVGLVIHMILDSLDCQWTNGVWSV